MTGNLTDTELRLVAQLLPTWTGTVDALTDSIRATNGAQVRT